MASFMFGWATHWAVFDKVHGTFIELSRANGKGAIISRPFDKWMARWKTGNPCKVLWTHPAVFGDAVIERARSKLGTDVQYALLARDNDPAHQNCEAFARWCHYKMSRSTQAQYYLPAIVKCLTLLVSTLLVLGWMCGFWGSTYPLVFIGSLPALYPLLFSALIPVLNECLHRSVGSTST